MVIDSHQEVMLSITNPMRILEQLEDRIVLDGTTHVDASQDSHTDYIYEINAASDDSESTVDTLGWVYMNNGWWYNSSEPSGWRWYNTALWQWYNEDTHWNYFPITGWYYSNDTHWWYNCTENPDTAEHWYYDSDHDYKEDNYGRWFWWDNINNNTANKWEQMWVWFKFTEPGNSNWQSWYQYVDWNGSFFVPDDGNPPPSLSWLQQYHQMYQDHWTWQMYWFDNVNDQKWELFQTLYETSTQWVYNDWDHSTYTYKNNLVNDSFWQWHTTGAWWVYDNYTDYEWEPCFVWYDQTNYEVWHTLNGSYNYDGYDFDYLNHATGVWTYNVSLPSGIPHP
jgi:hypothetical protein